MTNSLLHGRGEVPEAVHEVLEAIDRGAPARGEAMRCLGQHYWRQRPADTHD